MGIAVSCVSSKAPASVVKIIELYGSVQEFDKPMKVAQLMIDNPRHFVCHSSALQTGRRISAMTADEELELGHLYFLFPMRKLHHSLSPSDMSSLAFKVNSALQKSTSKSRSIARILPVLGDLCQSPADRRIARAVSNKEMNAVEKTAERQDNGVSKLLVDNAEDNAEAIGELRGFNLRSSKFWKPALETITESPRFLSLSRRISAVQSPST